MLTKYMWFLCSSFLLCCLHMHSVYANNLNPEKIDEITINNNVEACLGLEKSNLQVNGQTTKLLLVSKYISSTGNCGCKSSLLSYSVLETISVEARQIKYERAYGILVAPMSVDDKKTFEVILNSDGEFIYNGKVSIEVSCAPPD